MIFMIYQIKKICFEVRYFEEAGPPGEKPRRLEPARHATQLLLDGVEAWCRAKKKKASGGVRGQDS